MRPDPDALGSQVGLAELLRESFPEKEIRQVGETIEGLRFLADTNVFLYFLACTWIRDYLQ
ncbi:hypothetical protein EfmAA242_24700 [Enterococcus faecium]|nr:hypothetical protein EfmAA242_24700 [Enterococcus faecium]